MDSKGIGRKVTQPNSQQLEIKEAIKTRGEFKGVSVTWNKTSFLQKMLGDVGKKLYLWSGLGKSDVQRFHQDCAETLADQFSDMGDREAIRQILEETLAENTDIMSKVENLDQVVVDNDTIQDLKQAMAPKIAKENQAFIDRTITKLDPSEDSDLIARMKEIKGRKEIKSDALMTIVDITRDVENKKISERKVTQQNAKAQIRDKNKKLFNSVIDQARYPSPFSKDKGTKDYFSNPGIQAAFQSGMLTSYKGILDGSKELTKADMSMIQSMLGNRIYDV